MAAEIKVYGADWCPDCIRSKKVLEQNNIPYEYIDLVAHPEEKQTAESISGRRNIPVVLFPDGSFLSEPSDEELEKKL